MGSGSTTRAKRGAVAMAVSGVMAAQYSMRRKCDRARGYATYPRARWDCKQLFVRGDYLRTPRISWMRSIRRLGLKGFTM
jgi:hypothetical protein